MPYETSTDWISAARQIAQVQAARIPGNDEQIAERLIELHELMLGMPGPLKTPFAQLQEEEISPLTEARAARLFDGDWAWEVPPGCAGQRALLLVASEIRALDQHLADQQQLLGHPMETRIEVFQRWTLIRRNPAWRKQLPKRRYPYARRAMIYHRALPRTADGYPVRLVELNDVRLQTTRLAAAVAPGLKHTTAKADDRFTISKIDFPDGENVTRSQLVKSADDGSWAHVWPELTIGPALRDAIAMTLRDWDFDAPLPPALVVSGSCHEHADGKVVNRSWLMDSAGDCLARYDKLIPYETSKDGTEDIEPGTEIIILVTSGPVVAIGICKDLCDATREIFELDIDLVVIPSMGDQATTFDHLAAITKLRNSSGPDAFVVQQADPTAARQTNYVIGPKSELRKGADAMINSESWSSHRWI